MTEPSRAEQRLAGSSQAAPRLARSSRAGPPLVIRAIGCMAHAALERSGGTLAAVPGFDDAPYVQVGGEIIWIGNGIAAMHPRAVILDGGVRPAPGERLHTGALSPWFPTSLSIDAHSANALRKGCAALHRDLPRIGEPNGFAVILAGRAPDFPFDRVAPLVHNLAQAFHAADAESVYDAALPLLGLGPGLTSSGDDLVGAALFARRAIAGTRAGAQAWRAVAARLIDAARTRSHAIGAALFRDLALGKSFAPLHHLLALLASGAKREQAIDAARALVAIGHSSGWEMLAGFIIGTSGNLVSRREDGETSPAASAASSVGGQLIPHREDGETSPAASSASNVAGTLLARWKDGITAPAASSASCVAGTVITRPKNGATL